MAVAKRSSGIRGHQGRAARCGAWAEVGDVGAGSVDPFAFERLFSPYSKNYKQSRIASWDRRLADEIPSCGIATPRGRRRYSDSVTIDPEPRPKPTPEEIERYKRMTVAERLAETFRLSDLAWELLDSLPAEERARRLAIEEEEHRLSNEALLRALYRDDAGRSD